VLRNHLRVPFFTSLTLKQPKSSMGTIGSGSSWTTVGTSIYLRSSLANDFSSADLMAHQHCILHLEMIQKLRQIVGILIHVVALSCLVQRDCRWGELLPKSSFVACRWRMISKTNDGRLPAIASPGGKDRSMRL